MNDTNDQQLSAIEKFRVLHESGCFVMPNPWDAGTSRYLQHLGFEALATTSAGFAFSRGLADSASAIERYDMIGHVREIVHATPLPVNADFQNGFADDPQGVADNVSLCIATGVAGLSIEDSSETVMVDFMNRPSRLIESKLPARRSTRQECRSCSPRARKFSWLALTIRYPWRSIDWWHLQTRAPIAFTLQA